MGGETPREILHCRGHEMPSLGFAANFLGDVLWSIKKTLLFQLKRAYGALRLLAVNARWPIHAAVAEKGDL